MKQFVYKNTTTINKVDKVELPFYPIVRVIVHNQQEADEYLQQGVAIYEKIVETESGKHSYYFIEVSVRELAKVARKG